MELLDADLDLPQHQGRWVLLVWSVYTFTHIHTQLYNYRSCYTVHYITLFATDILGLQMLKLYRFGGPDFNSTPPDSLHLFLTFIVPLGRIVIILVIS